MKSLYIVYLFIGRLFLAYVAIVSSGLVSPGPALSNKYSSASESRVSASLRLYASTTSKRCFDNQFQR
jgi:hypothetical protein